MLKMKNKINLKILLLLIIISYIVINIFWNDSYKVENFFRIIAAITIFLMIKEGLRKT